MRDYQPLKIIEVRQETPDAVSVSLEVPPALREAFAGGARVPPRHHHHIPQPDGTEATLLLMPRREFHA